MVLQAHPQVLKAVPTGYTPWWAQRQFHRSRAPVRCIVAGRQSGKSHAAAEEVVRIMCGRPDSVSCLLMPNYKSTKPILKHIERALKPLAGRWLWREFDKYYKLSNGAQLYVRTADDKTGVPTRGLTIDGVLWVDEASFIPAASWEAARATQAAVKDPLVIITTTPCGKNWVYFEWLSGRPGPKKNPMVESFRFKTTDSPYCNQEFVAMLKSKLGAQRALQELDAHFLSDATAAFDPADITAIISDGTFPVRGERLSVGIDLAKEKDWSVAVLMNEFGEVWMLGRWQGQDWTVLRDQFLNYMKKWPDVALIVDVGSGGGHGGYMVDALRRELPNKKDHKRVHPVKTGHSGPKAQLMETLISDVQNHRIKVSAGPLAEVLRHELEFFEQHRYVSGGVERWRFHGPKTDGEHDDAVIALALALYGRLYAWEKADPMAGDFHGFGPADSAATAARSSTSARAATSTPRPFGGFGAASGRYRY